MAERFRSEIDRAASSLQKHLLAADAAVWQQKAFPPEFMPDADTLATRITYHDTPIEPIALHPWIKPDILAASENLASAMASSAAANQPIAYLPDSREIAFRDLLFNVNERYWRRSIVHAAGYDVTTRKTVIRPADYGERGVKVMAALQQAFDPLAAAEIAGKTYIEKAGIRELLCAEGYAIADLYNSPLITQLLEIFPFLLELATEQLMQRSANISRFENDLRSRRLNHLPGETHTNFAGMAYDQMAKFGWRRLLRLYAADSIEKMIDDAALLNGNNSAQGEAMIQDLLDALGKDEERIKKINAGLSGSGRKH